MAKADVVSAQAALVVSGQAAVLEGCLGSCYDQGGVDQKASDGTLSQADLDKAVADAKAADVALMQPQIDAAKAQVVALQADDDAKTALLKSIDAILHPAPMP